MFYDQYMTFKKLSPDVIRQHKGVSFTGITTVFFCHDGNGKLLLAKRSKKARDEHGAWDPGAGGLKHGQSLEENLRREMKEEYNVEPLEIDYIGYRDVFRTSPDGQPTHWLAMDFAVRIDPSKLKINEPEMVDEYGWFELDNLPSPLHSQFDLFMHKYGETLRRIMSS